MTEPRVGQRYKLLNQPMALVTITRVWGEYNEVHHRTTHYVQYNMVHGDGRPESRDLYSTRDNWDMGHNNRVLVMESVVVTCPVCKGRSKDLARYAQNCSACGGWGLKYPPNCLCPECGSMVVPAYDSWACTKAACYHGKSENNSDEPGWWRDGTKAYMDGNAWCATRADFINLQESPAGFGSSPQEAVDALVGGAVPGPGVGGTGGGG